MADNSNPGQFGNRPDTEEMARQGGQSQGQDTNPGNFANREDIEDIARQGGQSSH